MLGHVQAFISNIDLLRKTQFPSDKTSNIGYSVLGQAHFRVSASFLAKRNSSDITSKFGYTTIFSNVVSKNATNFENNVTKLDIAYWLVQMVFNVYFFHLLHGSELLEKKTVRVVFFFTKTLTEKQKPQSDCQKDGKLGISLSIYWDFTLQNSSLGIFVNMRL